MVGVPDDMTGENPWAFITLTGGATLSLEDKFRLSANCVEDIGEHAEPA